MTRHRLAVALVVATMWGGAILVAEPGVVPGSPSHGVQIERHHYSVAARIRPLVVFWITRSGVGDAIVTRQMAPGEATYALLIGSDPDRAARRIDRWGYIREEVRGSEARLVGLMTQSDEDTIRQAEANLKAKARGDHVFKIIRANVNGEQAHSVVTSIVAPYDYTYRQLTAVLDLARRDSAEGQSRTIHLPPGTRPGFLAALSDAMRASATARAIAYVYYGRIYELRQTSSRTIPNFRIGRASYGRAVAADFTVTSTYDGEQTPFSVIYGIEERYAQVPLTVSYRPRWWMEVNLTIDDEQDVATLGEGVDR
jgi:hypothetical protein